MNTLTRKTPHLTTSHTTNNSNCNSHSTPNFITTRATIQLLNSSEQHQDTHMHTQRLGGAAGSAHKPNQTTTTTLRTNYFTKQRLMANHSNTSRAPSTRHRRQHQTGASNAAVAQQLHRQGPTSNSTQDEATGGDRRSRLLSRIRCRRNQFIISIALVAASLAFVVGGAVQVTEAKPVTGGQRQQEQQQYQLVQFRRLPPKEFSAALGSSIIIECEAGAAPPPAIHWLRNGARIHQNDLDDNHLDSSQQDSLITSATNTEQISLSSTRSRLFIDCASLADEATYTCVAENAFSRVSTHTSLKIIRPIHVAAVEADLFAEDNELDNGGELPGSAMERSDDIELARAGPPPKRGVALDLETAEKSLSAVPQCLPNLHTSTTQAPLRIHMWTHNILERMKNSVLLYCRSNAANPTSTSQQSQEQQNNMNDDINNKKTLVTWTLPNDKQVEPNQNDKYEILSSGDLLIKDLRWSDMGSYICTVSNDQSSDSVSSFVYPSKRTWYVGDARQLRIRLAFTSYSLLSAKPTRRLGRSINKQAEKEGSAEVNNDSAIRDERTRDCLATFLVEKREGKWIIRGERSEIDWFNQRNGRLRLSVESESLWDEEEEEESSKCEDSPDPFEIVPYDGGRLETILVDRNSDQQQHQFRASSEEVKGSRSNYNGNQRRPRWWLRGKGATMKLETEMKTSGREFNWKCTSTTTNTMTSDNNWQRTMARKLSVADGMPNTLVGGVGDNQQSAVVYCGSAAATFKRSRQWLRGARGIDEDLSSLCAGCTTIVGGVDDHRGSLDDREQDGGDLLRDSYLDWLIKRESELDLKLVKPYRRLILAGRAASTGQGVSGSGSSSGADDNDDDEPDTDNAREPAAQSHKLTGVTRAGRKPTPAQTGTRRLLRGELLFIKMESLGGSLVIGEAQVAADCSTVFRATTNSEHDATTVSAMRPPQPRLLQKPENRLSDNLACDDDDDDHHTHEQRQDEHTLASKRDHKGTEIGRTSTLATSDQPSLIRDQMATELASGYSESSDKVGELNPWRQRRQATNSCSSLNNHNNHTTSGKRILAVILIDVLDRFIQLKPDIHQLIAVDLAGQGGGEFVFRDASAASSRRTRQQFAAASSFSGTTGGGGSSVSVSSEDSDSDDDRTSQEELTSVGGQLACSLFYELQLVCETGSGGPEVALEHRRKLMRLLREPPLSYQGDTPRACASRAGSLLRLRLTIDHATWSDDTCRPRNLYAKYRLLIRQPNSVGARLKLRLAGQSTEREHASDELWIVEGSTITSRANAQGRFHLGCTEELMLEPIWAEASVSSQLGQQRQLNQMVTPTPPALSETAELAGAEGPAPDCAKEKMAANMDSRWDVTQTTTTSSSTTGLASQQGRRQDRELSADSAEQQARSSRRPADCHQTKPLVDVPGGRNNSKRQSGAQHQVHQWPQLVVLLEFFSADFYRDKPQGFAHLIVPMDASGAIATNMVSGDGGGSQVLFEKQRLTRRTVPILSVPLDSIVDRLRHHLTGQLPQWVARVDSFSQCNSHRYMMQTRESGQIVIDYEIGRQFSHPLQHKLDLLDQLKARRISSNGPESNLESHTRMASQSEELDTEQVLEAYRRARQRMQNLRLAQTKVPA